MVLRSKIAANLLTASILFCGICYSIARSEVSEPVTLRQLGTNNCLESTNYNKKTAKFFIRPCVLGKTKQLWEIDEYGTIRNSVKGATHCLTFSGDTIKYTNCLIGKNVNPNAQIVFNKYHTTMFFRARPSHVFSTTGANVILQERDYTGAKDNLQQWDYFFKTEAPTPTPTTSPTRTCMTQDDTMGAMEAWESDPTAVIAQYGAFEEWKICDDVKSLPVFCTKRSVKTFNGDVGSWDVSSVKYLEDTFKECSDFDQDIGSWDVGNVKKMSGTFFVTNKFNQDISGWDVSNTKYLKATFAEAVAFNIDLSPWDIANVKSMWLLFGWAEGFAQKLCWDISKVKNTIQMFDNTIGGGIQDPALC